MSEFNLLNTVPKVVRDVGMRRENKEANRDISMQFGEAYFDGPREQGYGGYSYDGRWRSEEHTSELQSHHELVCRLLLEKKKK